MSDSSKFTADSRIIEEACAWVAQIESGGLSAGDFALLREWIARSPAHARELRAIAEMSGQLSALTELQEPLIKVTGAASALRARPHMRPLHAGLAAAAVMVVFAFMVSLFVLQLGPDRIKIYQTAIGEYRTIELPDRTAVSLNTNTKIEVDYSKTERRIRLLSGEALFDVASNPSRPFVVYSDGAVAQAVGTSFLLRLRNSVTELAVVEGAVAFAKLRPSLAGAPQQGQQAPNAVKSHNQLVTAPAVIVEAGHGLTSVHLPEEEQAFETIEIPLISARDIQRKISWVDGLFDFSKTPLSEVASEIARHNDISIQFKDASLRDVEFGGMFRTGDVEALFEALEPLGVAVEKTGEREFTLHRSPSATRN